MKLFVVAALVAVAAAGRLEHLERSYLPPVRSEIGTFGSTGGNGFDQGSFGSPSSQASFRANSGNYGSAGSGLPSRNAGALFRGATSNQYLPPDNGPSASSGTPQFVGSLQGFGAQNYQGQQYRGQHAAAAQQNAIPSTQYGTPQASSFGTSNYQAQFPQQSVATSRQYLAPQRSFQNTPQQPFDEQTGYHY